MIVIDMSERPYIVCIMHAYIIQPPTPKVNAEIVTNCNDSRSRLRWRCAKCAAQLPSDFFLDADRSDSG